MKRKMKLRLEDLQVSSFAADSGTGGVHGNVLTLPRNTCACPQTRPDESCACYPASPVPECTALSCPGGGNCVTEQFGGGETCETGPYYYC